MIAVRTEGDQQDELTVEVIRYTLAADNLAEAVESLRSNMVALKGLTDEFVRE